MFLFLKWLQESFKLHKWLTFYLCIVDYLWFKKFMYGFNFAMVSIYYFHIEAKCFHFLLFYCG